MNARTYCFDSERQRLLKVRSCWVAGFTFSFPMKQHSISSGELLTWTKSFKCGGLAGVDVAALLQRCLRARRLRVRVRVLLNDTTGTLVAGAMQDQQVGVLPPLRSCRATVETTASPNMRPGCPFLLQKESLGFRFGTRAYAVSLSVPGTPAGAGPGPGVARHDSK